MPEYIPKDFAPSEETYQALQKNGIPREFLDLYVTEHFIEYWTELKTEKKKKGRKSAWQTTYRVWARRSFHSKPGKEYEERRHWRQGGGSLGSDVFGKTLEKLSANAKEEPAVMAAPAKYRLPDPPEPGEAMDAMDAIAQMKEKLGVK